MDRLELERQACVLGDFIAQDSVRREFGLAEAQDADLRGDPLDLPVVQSIRSTRRVGPDGKVVFDLIAEVTQRRSVQTVRGQASFLGGCTVIFDPTGRVRYVISKNVLSPLRIAAFRSFISSDWGHKLWTDVNGNIRPIRRPFALLHLRTETSP